MQVEEGDLHETFDVRDVASTGAYDGRLRGAVDLGGSGIWDDAVPEAPEIDDRKWMPLVSAVADSCSRCWRLSTVDRRRSPYWMRVSGPGSLRC